MRISSGENDVPQCVLAITINENISYITGRETLDDENIEKYRRSKREERGMDP